ncbi:MAG: hypothetical protein WCG25_09125, partial [bacterium]
TGGSSGFTGGFTGGSSGFTGGITGGSSGFTGGSQHIFNILVNNSSLTIQFQSVIATHHNSVLEISFKTKSVLGPKIPSTAQELIYSFLSIASTNLLFPFIFIIFTHFMANICNAAIHSAPPVFSFKFLS